MISEEDKVDLRAWLWEKGVKATIITDMGAEAIKEWKKIEPSESRIKTEVAMVLSFIVGIVIGVLF